MKTLLVLCFFVVTALFSQSSINEMKTVDYVDINKYLGTWFEVAKIPNSFQKKCIDNTTAKYELMDDGQIKVINSCDKKDGKRDKADGIAKIVDTKTNSKLKVSFFSILGWRPFWGDYWIIGLDADYEYAVVGTPSRKYGWVLGRTRTLNEDKTKEVMEILRLNGYDLSKFEWVKK